MKYYNNWQLLSLLISLYLNEFGLCPGLHMERFFFKDFIGIFWHGSSYNSVVVRKVVWSVWRSLSGATSLLITLDSLSPVVEYSLVHLCDCWPTLPLSSGSLYLKRRCIGPLSSMIHADFHEQFLLKIPSQLHCIGEEAETADWYLQNQNYLHE